MRIKKGFEIRRIGSEDIVVASGIENIDFSSIISMNGSSVMLWKSVKDRDFSPETLADLLTASYDVDPETALKDAKDLCEQWLKAGITEE